MSTCLGLRGLGLFIGLRRPSGITDTKWAVDSAGNWETAANWKPENVPTSKTSAVLGSIITAPRVVTLTAPADAKKLTINAGFAYTLAGSALTVPSIAIKGTGTPTISCPLVGTAGLAVNNAPAATISGVISGTTLTKSGAGALTLSGANTYTGATTITAGTLAVGASGTIPTTSQVSGAGTLDISGFNTTIGGISGTVAVTQGIRTLVVGSATDQNYSGIITGTGPVTKQGAGIWTISALQAFAGPLTINAGTVKAGAADVWTPIDVQLADVAGATLDLNGYSETIYTLSGGGTTGGEVTSSTACTLTYGNGDNAAIGGRIRGALSLVKIGAGASTWNGANDFTGTLAINIGSIIAGANNVIPSTCAITFANTAGASLDLFNKTMSILSLAGGGATGGGIDITSATLNLTGSVDTAYAGVLSGASTTINKSGAGVQTLSGTNTCTGTLNIAAGSSILVGGADALSTMLIVPADGATIRKAAGALSLVSIPTQTWPVGTVNWLVGSGNFVWGSGAIALSGNVTHNLSETDASVQFGGSITGTGDITKTGAGKIILTANNSFTGNFYINEGTLQFNNNVSCPTGSTVNIGATSGSADALGIFASAFSKAINFPSGSSGAAIMRALTATSTLSGAITIARNMEIQPPATALTLQGGLTGTGNVTYNHNQNATFTINTVAFNNIGTFTTTGTGGDTKALLFTLGLGANVTNVVFGANGIHQVTGTMLNTGTFSQTAGTLRGIGSVKGTTITIGSGVNCMGGTGAGNAGTLTLNGPTTFSSGAIYQVNIGSTTTVSKIAVTGALTLNGNTVNFQAAALDAGTYTIMECTGTPTGTLVIGTLPTGRTFSNFTYASGSVTVTFT